jgi:pullulanase/glycogen debranching enzyme
VNRLRARLQRAVLATTLLAQGTPMLCAGDELGHTQSGNNNPYCQDSELTWIDWTQADAELLAFTVHLSRVRRAARPFGTRWYSGLTDPLGLHDLAWITRSGEALRDAAWSDPASRVLGCLIGEPGRAAAPLLLLVNAEADDTTFLLPAGVWEVIVDTSTPTGAGSWHGQGEVELALPAGTLLLLAAAGADVSL